FAQYVPIGNYNYICPYAHEMTHGLLLSLASLACAWRYKHWGLLSPCLAGGALGLAFLTKAEVFLPGPLPSTIALGFSLWIAWPGPQRLAAVFGSYLAAMIVPLVIAVVWLSIAMPVSESVWGALGSWITLFETNPAGQKYFQQGMGTDDILGNLQLLADSTGRYALILIPAGALGFALRKPGNTRLVAGIAAFVLVTAVLWPSCVPFGWGDAFRPLPGFIFLAGSIVLILFLRERRKGRSTERLVRQLSLVVFAFLLLGKMILNTRIYHYGFVLAMPATLVLVAGPPPWGPPTVAAFCGAGGGIPAASLAGVCGCI